VRAVEIERRRLLLFRKIFPLLQRLPGFVILYDLDRQVRFVNRYFRDRFGGSGKHLCHNVLTGSAGPCAECAIYDDAAGDPPREWEGILPDGRAYRMHALPFIEEDGAPFVLVLGIDVTGSQPTGDAFRKTCEALERRIAERTAALSKANEDLREEVRQRREAEIALREATQALQGIIHASPLAVLLLDPEGRVTLWNPAAERTFGWTEEEILGRFNPIVPEEEEEAFRVFLSRALAGEVFAGLEAKRRRKDGTLRDVLVSTAPLRDALGTIRGNISIIADVTERKRAEEQLKEAHSDLRQFSYVASHDLQEPLRSIASFTQLLAKRYRGRLDADADDFIDFIVEGASRMQTLIDDLLAYSRVGTHGKSFARVDCEEILSRALANLRAAVAESGAVVTHDPLPAVGGDGSQLVQLFQNLLSNAVKFRKNDVPRIHVSVKMDGSEWTFGVEDNGIGIDPRHADRVFTVFQRLHTRREYPGTGIGLAVCKRIVERHGGRIWVESLPGEGSTFRFTIPAREV
jgi:PAS domain S-box-containing protein